MRRGCAATVLRAVYWLIGFAPSPHCSKTDQSSAQEPERSWLSDVLHHRVQDGRHIAVTTGEGKAFVTAKLGTPPG
jgi:hypothetical protein